MKFKKKSLDLIVLKCSHSTRVMYENCGFIQCTRFGHNFHGWASVFMVYRQPPATNWSNEFGVQQNQKTGKKYEYSKNVCFYHFKISVLSMVFLHNSINNFVVGSEENELYIGDRHASKGELNRNINGSIIFNFFKLKIWINLCYF